MDTVYCDLLSELGYTIPEKKHPTISEKKEEEPIYWNWGSHVLRNNIDSERPFAINWSDEILLVKKRIHRYSRMYRFRTILKQLIGFDGPTVPDSVLELIFSRIKNIKSRKHVWNAIRKVLKKNDLRKYYVQIAEIIWRLGGPRWLVPEKSFSSILQDFHDLHVKFNREKKFLKRKYFPPLIYTALYLLQKHSVKFPYKIPLARTVRKRKSLDLLFINLENLPTTKIEKCVQWKLDIVSRAQLK